MQQDLSEIAVILDRSGSMAAIADDAIGGYNAFLEAQRREPGRGRLTLVLFDHDYDLALDAVPLEQATPLDRTRYVPRGTTALLDAMGRTIDAVGARLAATPEAERPGRVVVAVLTDGMENASRDYDAAKVREMVGRQQAVYGWSFVFLAANQDAFEAADQVGVARADAAAFVAEPDGTRAGFAALSQRVSERRRH